MKKAYQDLGKKMLADREISCSQIGITLLCYCSVITFKSHTGLLLRWLQGWVRMLHCWVLPLEAFKDVFWIYVEHDNLERQNIVERNISTTGNLTPASFTVTLTSVFAHPKKEWWYRGCLGECNEKHGCTVSLCLPCQHNWHNCTIKNQPTLENNRVDPAHPLHTYNKRTPKESGRQKTCQLLHPNMF